MEVAWEKGVERMAAVSTLICVLRVYMSDVFGCCRALRLAATTTLAVTLVAHYSHMLGTIKHALAPTSQSSPAVARKESGR